MVGKCGGFRIGAVIPAAGMSSRMGGFKPLLPLGDSTVIERTVSAVLPYAQTIAVVLGNRADEVQAALEGRFGNRLIFVRNPDFRTTDMLYSVQLGLQKLADCDGFFLLPGDMPMIGSAVFAALIERFDEEARVIYPVYHGKIGHPPLIPASLIPAILAYEGEGGLKAVLRKEPSSMIAVPDVAIMLDLDTPEDYRAAQESP